MIAIRPGGPWMGVAWILKHQWRGRDGCGMLWRAPVRYGVDFESPKACNGAAGEGKVRSGAAC